MNVWRGGLERDVGGKVVIVATTAMVFRFREFECIKGRGWLGE